MTRTFDENAARSWVINSVMVLALLVGLGMSYSAKAQESEAKKLVKAMSDYMAAQRTISFGYDTNLEVVTKDHQKILLASSGSIDLSRPDKIRVMRSGGFVDAEIIFNGKVLTVVGKNANAYAQLDIPGTLDHLVDELRDKYHRPVPGADLLLSNIYDQLMPEVIDAKDLGSGIIGGIECDHLAIRTQEVDWQIWIAQGPRPYPCRYVITAKQVDQAPQYSVQIRDWKTGNEVKTDDYAFTNATNARKVDIKEAGDFDELPKQFTPGAAR
jgi:hypothetical protein